MRKWMVFCALLMLGTAAFAAEGWLTDFEKAQAQAKAENKYVLVDFSGSDWCGWCIKLEEEVFSRPAFKAYASEKLVLMLADFPSRTKLPPKVAAQNKALAQRYAVRGYPTVILLTPEGKLAGRTGYQRGGAEAYVKHIQSLINVYEGK